MIHSGGRRRRHRRGSKGPYERGGDGEVDGSPREAKGCMDAAATDAQAGSTLGSGCCAAMAHAWMEEFSGDKLSINPLKETDMILLERGFCHCEKGEELPKKNQQEPPPHQLLQQKNHQQCQQQAAHTPKSMVQKPEWNTHEEVKEVHLKQNVPEPSSYLHKSSVKKTPSNSQNTQEEVKEVHVKENVPAPSSYLLKSSGLKSLFVKASGVSVSIQVDVSNTKVDYLINSACEKLGVKAQDTYAVLCGKVLDYDKSLSEYLLYQNSTVEIRYRGRAGQLNWDQKFNVNDTVLYYDVNLDPALQNAGIQAFQYARFFSDFSSYNIFRRHPAHLQANIKAMAAYASHASLRASMGPYAYAWKGSAQLVPELNNVLIYQPSGKPLQWKNPLYTDNAKGCLHFANNFLKHARNRFPEEQIEAAFALHMKNFLPKILQGLAELADRTPNRQYINDIMVGWRHAGMQR
ncbi:hypothetical protein OsJ_00170 [Oryza sativa Japonica Group]|uniref:Ubiquitin-like domain-containing protein n=1 Tax=Oryza sativa subsp. japonica TaxID=39947 RepID=B9EZ90_ORYSJ|nr:hypothetical protein OsJ_00170 [Oryza sativa Japonica Group]